MLTSCLEQFKTFELLDKDKDGNLSEQEIAEIFGDDIKGNCIKKAFNC